MMDMIRGSVSDPYVPEDGGRNCCDVEVTVRVVNGKGLEVLTRLLQMAGSIRTELDRLF